jgi:hypothetical protein
MRDVYGDRQAAWKLLRQFVQRIGAASKQGDFRAAIRQRDRRRQPDPRRSAGDDEHAIFDLHRSILLFSIQPISIEQRAAVAGAQMRYRSRFVIAHVFEIGD